MEASQFGCDKHAEITGCFASPGVHRRSVGTRLRTCESICKDKQRLKNKIKKITLLLSLLLFTLLPTHAVKKVEANAINVAVMLTEQPDSAGIASTCEYYGYVSQPKQDCYNVYKHPNGSIIRYTFTTAEDGKSYPTVEVKSKASQKGKEEILQGVNFKKEGKGYERRAL